GDIQFWQGGTGTWDSATQNWADVDGTPGTWNSRYGVFEGTAGTVTLAGTQGFQGLQFATDGYTLTGGALNALPDASGVATPPGVITLQTNVAGQVNVLNENQAAISSSGKAGPAPGTRPRRTGPTSTARPARGTA
ncbi:hypothetical protein CTI14_43155, partial [Methylobacterium radiotolerans]